MILDLLAAIGIVIGITIALFGAGWKVQVEDSGDNRPGIGCIIMFGMVLTMISMIIYSM